LIAAALPHIDALPALLSSLRYARRLMISRAGNHPTPTALFALIGGLAMRTFVGMILGALLMVAGVYIYDSQQTSTVANGQTAPASRTIVNWDVAASDWNLLKRRAQDDWIKLSSK
jgi:hypothetical protein